jgi:Xaa-Pro aminopeptidase
MTEIAGIWETAVEAGYRATKAGESERSVAQRLAHNLLNGGADWVPFYSFASGPERTMIAHSVPDDTRVGPGTIMRVDMVGFFRGYYTDIGRMAVVGEPSAAQRDAYQKLVTLQREMIMRMQPGRRASDLYRESVAVGKELGLDFSMDAIGHSLGLRLHEYPILNPYEEETLVPNMLMCVEIMHPFKGLGRFHVEDLVRVREGGGERLTTKMDTSSLMSVG